MSGGDIALAERVAELMSGNWLEVFAEARDPDSPLLTAFRPLLHDDFEYRPAMVANQLGFSEVYRGFDGFVEASMQFIGDFEHFSTEADEFVDLGPGRVLVVGWNVLRTTGGDDMRFPGFGLMTIEDGRLRRYDTFASRADAEQAAGLH